MNLCCPEMIMTELLKSLCCYKSFFDHTCRVLTEPGGSGVSGNDRADRLASIADITSGLQLGRLEELSQHRQIRASQH